MAEYKTTLALEIGAQCVTMALFTGTSKGYVLSRYARKNIVLDPVEEGMRIDYVSNAVSELVKQLRVKGRDVRDVVSGQKVFLRFIKLPALDTVDDLSEQVGYEAQQHLPFPADEIVYSYQLLGTAEDGEQEVLLVAIKKDELDELNGQVEANTLRTRSVDCSITALYNAFRAAYPDETEPVMILDIGAKTTDILFIEEGRFFTRSVTAAGAFVTNSIARELKLSFREAEEVKVAQGLVSLGNGHTETMGESQAALASVIRNAMTRLSSEVQRTINHYRAQYKGSSPTKVYICGGGARLGYTGEFLQSTLDLPVEVLNPLNAVSVGSRLDTEALDGDAMCLGPVVGAALSGAKVGAFSIDLVPTSVGKDRAEKRLIPKVVTAGIIALVGAGICAYTADVRADRAQAELNKHASYIEDLDGLHRVMERNREKYDAALKNVKEIGALYAARYAYPDLLIQLAQKTSVPNLWLTSLDALVGYDAVNNALVVGQDGTDKYLLLDTRETRDGTMVRTPDADEKGKTPKVTALLVSGYYYKKSKDDQGKQLQRLNELVDSRFDESSPDSFFSFEQAKVKANGANYFIVQDAEKSRGSNLIPEYADKFYMVMPLKQALPLPGEEETTK